MTIPRLIGLIAIALGFVHYLPLPTLPIPWLVALHDDIAPELIGIGLTVILIDWAVTRQAQIERKAQLIGQLGSKYRDVTEMARVELKHEGWPQDGSLSGADLWGTNLSGADLRGANLSGADFRSANLSGASLAQRTNLNGVDLRGANLIGAVLPHDLPIQKTKWKVNFVINPEKWKAIKIESCTLRWSRDAY